MGKYNVYRLDGIAKIHVAEWLDALDDRYALEDARAIAGPGGCEVWQLNRKIGRVSLKPSCCCRSDRPPGGSLHIAGRPRLAGVAHR